MSVPVTVLCGELGAGKTTLLSALLESTDRGPRPREGAVLDRRPRTAGDHDELRRDGDDLEVTGRWIASLSEERQEQYREAQNDLSWDEEWGDRETRLALIGRDLSMDDLRARLDDCLLTDAEMDADWSTFENAAPTGMSESATVSSDE